MHKESTGFADFPLSDITEAYQKFGRLLDGINIGSETFVDKAVLEFKNLLNSCHFIDEWSLANLMEKENVCISSQDVIFVKNGNLNGPSKRLFNHFFKNHEKVIVQFEIPLDASFSELNYCSDLKFTNFENHCLDKRTPNIPTYQSGTEDFAFQLMKSHLRLLINTKDELSLTKSVCSGTVCFYRL